MVTKNSKKQSGFQIKFVREHDGRVEKLSANLQRIFQGKYLQHLILEKEPGKTMVYVGIGSKKLTPNELLEVSAYGVSVLKEYQIQEFILDVKTLVDMLGISCLEQVAHGICLGCFEKYKPYQECVESCRVYLKGIKDQEQQEAWNYMERGFHIGEGVLFAREMVNCPANQLRPMDMGLRIKKELDGLENDALEVRIFTHEQIRELGMQALCGIGESSINPPCFVEIRYNGGGEKKERLGLAGKGVTIDTGGYCLKPAGSMAGIKGDMAGAAAVAGAIYAMAKNKVKRNVSAFLPMCENRISNGSLLPGDVIGSYSGKTIEVMNTDAEGRLILADAVSYGVREGKVDAILDIATLTGSVVNMLGFSIAGVLSDSDEFYEKFSRAYEKSGEQYHRLPFGPEHEKMIRSQVADVKNIGESCCGTITAGLFIRMFAEGIPWLHVDIAGTAWVDTPVWSYQKQGATGAAVSTLYYLCEEK